MNKKYCIFDSKKLCNNCGECEVCELDPNKKCNNCGKCLEMDNYDMRAIKVDEIIENENDAQEYNENSSDNTAEIHSHLEENKDTNPKKVIYIDDIDGLKEILEDKNKFEKMAHEEYPGLIKINKKNT